MKTWSVQLAEHQTQIYFGQGIGQQLGEYLPELAAKKVLVLTDTNLAPIYLQQLTQQLAALSVTVVPVIISTGESSKELATVLEVYQTLIAEKFSRQDYLLAFGGGVIGDLGGLVASTYMRGMKFIQIPTSIVAQSDSSLGGKTAIDYQHYKNLIGTFYPASKILVDPDFLKTLPAREISCGLAEVIKSLLVSPEQPLDYQLLQQSQFVTGELPSQLSKLVQQALLVKTHFVQEDFYDFKERRFLNFGHTIGHSVEALANGRLHHGEAVSIGMVTMMRALVQHQLLAPDVLNMLTQRLQQLSLPIELPDDLTHEAITQQLALDKKAVAGQIQLVLLKAPGQTYLQTMAISDFAVWLGW
ncbi:3-dehydroquinate synthase [Lapidilactobacillus wuchangensis]|uniref:3-dehydroquinate synthase n=1 Tax=Lapidilactobacillus wuchangensis TaxID=2486001 RepID=UPI000F782F2E|nr:3-dehydroquinate synthase [Lapidilactobacillus wuchangensis]